MPIYEYDCTECNKRFEVIQKMSDPDLTKCEGCENQKCSIKKVPSTYGMNFVGTGFYKTDYKK